METNYRIAYQKGWKDLKRRIPGEVAIRRGARFDEETLQLTVGFLHSEYVLDYEAEAIHRKSDGKEPDIMAAILILNFLSFSNVNAASGGNWVSLKEIPNGGALFYPAFRKNPIEDLIATFGKSPELLLRCAAELGGEPATLGSVSVLFHPFSGVPVCVVLWEGDEEISANATILFQPSISDLLHIESIIGLGTYLGTQLIQLANK